MKGIAILRRVFSIALFFMITTLIITVDHLTNPYIAIPALILVSVFSLSSFFTIKGHIDNAPYSWSMISLVISILGIIGLSYSIKGTAHAIAPIPLLILFMFQDFYLIRYERDQKILQEAKRFTK